MFFQEQASRLLYDFPRGPTRMSASDRLPLRPLERVPEAVSPLRDAGTPSAVPSGTLQALFRRYRSTAVRTLRPADFLLLAGFCAVLFVFPLFFSGRSLTTHETVHCQNVREMRADGDWIVPHYGGRPWLERPPLPFWLTLPVVAVVGDVPAAYRLASALAAVPCVLLLGWMASVWFGREVGLLAGLVLATLRLFNHYATGAEADIFLCTAITAALALFVRLEFQLRPAREEGGFLGGRPWTLVGLFVLLGLANLVKGLFFGDALILMPIAAYLLLGRERWSLVRRYVWLPGWLLWLAVGSAWALAVCRRYPDVVDLWFSDYAGRVNQGYMREPAWYYLQQLPLMLFPWLLPALVGLGLTWRQALRQGRTPERFLWCWALLPLLVLSLPQGKHQHYLLHAVAPWAVLAALGAVRIWRRLHEVRWLATPWPTLLLAGVPGEIALAVLAPRVRAPEWFVPVVLCAWPALLLGLWYSLTRRQGVRAATGVFALLVLVFWGLSTHQRVMNDRYAGDRAFVRAIGQTVPAGATLLVLDDWGPLDASWMLFHLEGRGQLLHNSSFLRDGRISDREVYVVARSYNEHRLAAYGTSRRVIQSTFSRAEPSPAFRYGLYYLRFHEDLVRHREPVYISPMQATGRAPGPDLDEAAGARTW